MSQPNQKRPRVAAKIAALAVPLCLGTLHSMTPPATGQVPASPEFAVEDVGFTIVNSSAIDISNLPAINATGQVAGTSGIGNGVYRAHRTNEDLTVRQDLGALGGEYSEGADINASAQVAGTAQLRDGTPRAFRFTTGQGMRELGTLGEGGFSEGNAINDLGQVAGLSSTNSESVHAFRFTDGQGMADLGTLGGFFSVAYGINNQGRVVGVSDNGQSSGRAFRTAPNAPINPATDDLGDLGGGSAVAYSINNAGEVAGQSQTANQDRHAFRYVDGAGMQDLGTLSGRDSIAYGINNRSQVVGESSRVAERDAAFLYTDAMGMLDLNDLIDPASGWLLLVASDINDRGQIVGLGLKGTQLRVFRLSDVRAPVVTSCSVTPTALPAQGGTATISMEATDLIGVENPRAFVSRRIIARGRPGTRGQQGETVPLTRVSGNRYEGTFNAAPNTTTQPVAYSVSVLATDPAGNTAEEACEDITVAGAAGDTQAPRISDCVVSPRSLPSAGGSVNISAVVVDNSGASQVTAQVTNSGGSTVSIPLTPDKDNRYRGSFSAPPTGSTGPERYQVLIVARDASGNEASESCGHVTVGGGSGQQPGGLRVSPQALPFGRVEVGDRVRQTLVLRNADRELGSSISGTISAPNAPFRLIGARGVSAQGQGSGGSIPFTLAPGQQRALTVEFAPTRISHYRDSLSIIRSDGEQESLVVRLSGRGCRKVRR
ncbi:MAG TPA: hypothetical protein VK689_18010 [Armatimonadota bacterium]|nr:hypothetical protein [Armatimonadota bacterium]